jgi:AraC-like DNA-binding protein
MNQTRPPRSLIPLNYETPAVRYQGALRDLLCCLLPCSPLARITGDQRIAELTDFIDRRDGRIGWNLEDTCRELKLNISAAYAARLFKRSTGLGIREYAKNRRLSAAAKFLAATDFSVKAVAVECGYRSPPDFTRRFKEYFHLTPSDFRRRALLARRGVAKQLQSQAAVGGSRTQGFGENR